MEHKGSRLFEGLITSFKAKMVQLILVIRSSNSVLRQQLRNSCRAKNYCGAQNNTNFCNLKFRVTHGLMSIAFLQCYMAAVYQIRTATTYFYYFSRATRKFLIGHAFTILLAELCGYIFSFCFRTFSSVYKSRFQISQYI